MVTGSNTRWANPTRPTGERRSTYRPDLDGLRGIAILLVVGFHAGVPGFDGGFVGVDIFFVISGYLIVGLLFRELQARARIDWRAFYARRARRLLPAALLMVMVVVGLSVVLLNPVDEVPEVTESALASSIFMSNLYFWRTAGTDYFNPMAAEFQPLLHTWSLSVEEQFYVALPLGVALALVLARLTRRTPGSLLVLLAVLLTLGSLAAAVWFGHWRPVAGFYLPITRAYEFGIGAVLVLLGRAPVGGRVVRALALLGTLGLLACLLRPLPTAAYPGAWALLPTLATAALILSAGAWLPSRLAAGPLVSLGRVSYGWYLWHWPLISLATVYNLGTPSVAVRVALALVGLALAVLSYRYVELRFHAPAHRIRPVIRRPGHTLIAAAVATALVAGTALSAAALAEARVGRAEWQAMQAQLADYRRLPPQCDQSPTGRLTTTGNVCVLVDAPDPVGSVVLWGDSHAWHYVPALQEAAVDPRVQVIAATASSCPPLLGQRAHRGSASELTEDCLAHSERTWQYVQSRVQAGVPVRLVLAARWNAYLDVPPVSLVDQATHRTSADTVADRRAMFAAGFPRLVETLVASRLISYVVAPSPELRRVVPQCLHRRLRVYECGIDRQAVEQHRRPALSVVERALTRLRGLGHLIDPVPAVCTPKVCAASTGGVVNYFDDDHLSATRSALLAGLFTEVVDFSTD